MIKRIVSLVLLVFVSGGPFSFAIANDATTEINRPRIAVVLSGGGARGLAHIGVLKALHEMRVPVDCIVGTSMGALVGGMYATGMSPLQIEQMVADNDLATFFNDLPPRADRPFIIKRDDYRPLFDFSLGVNSNGIQLPAGVSAGYRFELFIREIIGLGTTRSNLDFDTLPTPFRATATNLENGQLKVFKRGDIARVMRASMSIPAVIAPVQFEGKTYIDGGFVENLPVGVGRAVCGDIIIAVNLGSEPKNIEEVRNSLDVVLQSYLILSDQNVNNSIASLTDQDILITPELNDIDSNAFDNSPAIIAKGTEAAHLQKQKLEQLSVSSEQYQRWLSERKAKILSPIRIKSISANTTGSINAEVVMQDISTEAGDQFNVQQFNDELIKLYGRGDFSYVGYSVVTDEKNTGEADIIVDAVSKPWGPGYLKFGLGVATDFDTPTQFNLAASYRQTWINSLGAEWRTEMQLGYDSFLTTEFIQPLQIRDGAFVMPYSGLRRNTIQFYKDQLRVGQFKVKQFEAGVDTGVTGKYGVLKIGPYFRRVQSTPDFGLLTTAFETETTSEVGLRLNAVYDQLDSLHFPRSGSRASGSLLAAKESWGSGAEYTLAQVKLSSAISFGDHTLLGHAEWGDDISGVDNIPYYLAFKLGGPGRLSGLYLDQLTGSRYSLAALSYYYKYDTLPSQIGRGMYIGTSLEAGRINDQFIENADQYSTAGSVYWGADTVLGSVYIGYGISSRSQRTFYLVISDTYF